MLMAPLMQGITIILEPEYEPKKWVEDILKYKPNVICATKSFWDAAIKEKLFTNRNLSFVNIAVQGGEPNTKQMEDEINTVLKECNCKQHVVVGYGMSEFNGTLSTSSLKFHKEGSAGIPLPGVVISSFDTVTGKECKNNERGEIMATSPCIMRGYSNDVALTEKFKWSDSEGRVWFRTGDIGYVDDQGEVYVLGRAIDAIKYSEKTVYMFDIEKMVQQLPGIVTCKVVSNSENKIYINIISQNNNEIELVKAVETKVLNDIGLADLDFSIKTWEGFPINANGKCDRAALMAE